MKVEFFQASCGGSEDLDWTSVGFPTWLESPVTLLSISLIAMLVLIPTRAL